MPALDHDSKYEVLKELAPIQPARRFAAREQSLASPVILNRVAIVPGGAAEHDCLAEIASSATCHSPRMMRVTDCWTHGNEIVFTTIEPEGAPLIGGALDATTPEDARWRAIRHSLLCLSSMHERNAVHGFLGRGSFGIDRRTGEIAMLDNGIFLRMARIIRKAEAGESNAFMLAENLLERDVSDWAELAMEFLTGEKLMPPRHGLTPDYEPREITEAAKKVRARVDQDPLQNFLIKCLKGRSKEGGGFDTAQDAFVEYNKHDRRGAFP